MEATWLLFHIHEAHEYMHMNVYLVRMLCIPVMFPSMAWSIEYCAASSEGKWVPGCSALPEN